LSRELGYGKALPLFKQAGDRLGQANVWDGLGDLESKLGRVARRWR
jgi:hypothetical protein